MLNFLRRFFPGSSTRKTRRDVVREGIRMHQNLSERQIDKILADSFPCSDPPPWH